MPKRNLLQDICAGYARYSTPKQDGGVTIEAQELHMKRLVSEKKWSYLKTYSDVRISGAVIPSERPGLTELLDDARLSKFQRVITYDASRLARDQHIFWDIVNAFKETKIIYLTVVMPEIDSTKPEFEMVAGTLQGMASYERLLVGIKTKDAHQILDKAGKAHGRPMFGFVINEKGYFEPDKIGLAAIELVTSNKKASAKSLKNLFPEVDYYKLWSALKNARIYLQDYVNVQ